MKDERGVTLVEILATLTLLSIIGILVWSVFLQGMKNTDAGSTKTRLTQELNYVQATLRNIHLKSDYYNITFPTNCSIHVEYGNAHESTFQLFEDDHICYQINNEILNDKKDVPFDIDHTKIEPKKEHHSISFDLMLKDKLNESVRVKTRTNLSRLKEEIINE